MEKNKTTEVKKPKKNERMVRVISPNAGQHLETTKIGRNELCRCGSGKKVKNCCNETTKWHSVPNHLKK